MGLRYSACLALTGTSLLAIVLIVHLVLDGWGVLNGVLPVIRLGASLIRVFASVSLAVFLYEFYRRKA